MGACWLTWAEVTIIGTYIDYSGVASATPCNPLHAEGSSFEGLYGADGGLNGRMNN